MHRAAKKYRSFNLKLMINSIINASKDLIFELQNNNFASESIETVNHPQKIDILFKDLTETENRAKKVLESLDLEELKQDVKESKTLLNVHPFNFILKSLVFFIY